MYRRSDWLELGFLGLSFILLFAGYRLNLSIVTNLGGVCIGAFTLVGGIQAIRSRRVGFETHQKNFGRISTYTGLSAQLLGILFIALAVLIFVLVGFAWFNPGGAEAFWADLFGSPRGWGVVLLCIGLTAAVNGIIRLLAGSAGYYQGLADSVERISGVIPLLFGLGLALSGIFLILIPEVILSLVHLALTTIKQRFFQ